MSLVARFFSLSRFQRMIPFVYNETFFGTLNDTFNCYLGKKSPTQIITKRKENGNLLKNIVFYMKRSQNGNLHECSNAHPNIASNNNKSR